MKLPIAIDGSTGKPSVTLTFAYVAFILSACLIVYLAPKDSMEAALCGLMLFFGCLVIYRMRALDKFKFSLQERSIELSDEPDVNEKKKEE